MKKHFARALGIAVLAVLLVSPARIDASNLTPLPLGAAAPAISEPTAKGTFDTSVSTKPYVIEFFAVWCPHCQREVPVMNQLQGVDGDRADIIAIPASPVGFDKTTPLAQSDIDEFVHHFNVNYRIGFDGFYSAAFDYGVSTFPTFYVVDATRHVVAEETGEVPFQKLHADITAALAAR